MAVRKISFAKAVVACSLLGAAGGFWVFSTLRQASRELGAASHQVDREGQFSFRTVSLDRPVPSGFQPISSPNQFSDATLFNGKLYLCGPTGLLAFDLNGSLNAEYHAGMELPPAPLVQMATGYGASSTEPRLWIATQGEGVLVFDGRSFQQIRPDAATARSLTTVLSLATGRVLLGTERSGVLVWDGGSLAQLHPALAGLRVTALAGSETDLWIGTVDQGLWHWHAGQADRFSDSNGLPDPRVLSIAASPEATYAGTALGVAEFRDGKLIRTLAPGFFAKSLLVRGETLLIGTLEEGVIEVPLQVRQPRPRNRADLAESAPVERLFDLNGRLFVLAEDGLYEKGRPVFAMPGQPLTDRNISAIAADSTGRLWVGYFDRGLDILEPGFEHRTHYEDEHIFCVNRIVHAPGRGLTAAGTANGLVLFDASGKPRQTLTKAEGLIANNVTDVLLRPEGRELGITVATPAGLTMIHGGQMSSLYAFHGLVSNHVYALAASNSKLMAGTLGGLSMLDGGIVQANYTTANSGLKQNWITAIEPDGDEWFIGTYGSGIVKLDGAGRWSTFPDLKGRIEINVNAITSSPRAVYAGTLGRGLAVYNRASGRWSFIISGLPSDNVTALTFAGGYLYVGTSNGLVRIPEQQVPMQ